MIYLASDHGGFNLKNELVSFLQTENVDVKDMGPETFEKSDDYPDYVIPVMRKLQGDVESKAILLCRNGVGVCMLANKFKGIRCVLSWNPDHAKSSRKDDNTNVLALPADYLEGKRAKQVVAAWLTTDFSGEERHKRRLEKVSQVLS